MKKNKIFKFLYGKVIDLDSNPEYGCTTIVCGHDKFTLRNFKLQEGHDDSLPYSAILCCNGVDVCKCVNDGWGGQTEMTVFDALTKAKYASLSNKLCSNYKWSSHGVIFNLDLDFIADTLAISHSLMERK